MCGLPDVKHADRTLGRACAPRDQEWVTWARTDTPSPLPSSLWHAPHESAVSHPQKPSSPAEVQKMVSCVCSVVAVLFLFLKKKLFLFLVWLQGRILAILSPKEHKSQCPKTPVKKCCIALFFNVSFSWSVVPEWYNSDKRPYETPTR